MKSAAEIATHEVMVSKRFATPKPTHCDGCRAELVRGRCTFCSGYAPTQWRDP